MREYSKTFTIIGHNSTCQVSQLDELAFKLFRNEHICEYNWMQVTQIYTEVNHVIMLTVITRSRL